MVVRVSLLLALVLTGTLCSPEEAEHRDFQYNSVVDPATGRYNFAYDTGNDNDVAHSLHMQYKDADGIVRGRYGYTDPNGKLRMVEYEAGPNGFIARGDVGPDGFPHGQAPDVPSPDPPSSLSGYREPIGNDFELDPAPVQMAGWDPEVQPMDQPRTDEVVVEDVDPAEQNMTGDEAMRMFGPELGFFPRAADGSEDGSNDGAEIETEPLRASPESFQAIPVQENNDVNVYNIDVDPDDIRARASSGPVRRSADFHYQAPIVQETVKISAPSIKSKPVPIVQETVVTKSLPIVQERVYVKPVAVVRKSEKVQASSYQPVKARSSYYYPRHYHDHDAETRYYRARQTHNHDTEKYYYRPGQTHDHDAEVKYYKTRYYRPAARYYRPRQTHDHDAEKYYNRYYNYGRYSYPRRIYYRDSHSQEPHEHGVPYRNHHDHQHSDRQLYAAKYRNYAVPATAKPHQVQYIPSDKYHGKQYYWTYE